MLTDEQILAKTSAILENLDLKWPKNEEINEKVLREVTEDEMRVLEDVLDDLDTANLPLDDLFGGKMRTIIPFPTMDTESELGKFAKFFRDQDYEVEWDKGMVYAEREIKKDVVDFLNFGRNEPSEKKTKKIQMKIGKLFPKIAQTASKLDELFQIIKKKGEGKAWWNNATSPGQVVRNVVMDQLSDEQQKSWNRLMNQMYDYIPAPGIFPPKWDETVEYLSKMSKYWQQNAGYIKDEINNIDNDKYSIIITRHPIDVLRMSDFDNITSCHSPSSRTSAYQSYYKCAVAEAQGHGAVAYVVETEDLLAATNTGNIDSAEQEIQEGEIFADDKRPFVGDIEPISRARIRHVRYYDTDFSQVNRYDDGIDVGMPETRIYGAGIPGILDTVTDWARKNQEEVIQNMPKQDGMIDLNRFMIFGGSYEDTANEAGRLALMRRLLGPDVEVEGYMKQNTDTEDNLDADLIGDIVQQYENYCSGRTDYWNNHMAACEVEYNIEDDGDGGAYISAGANIKIEWEASDWKSLPNAINNAVIYSADVINDIYGDLLKSDGPYLQRKRNRRGEDLIVWHCDVEPEHPELGGRFLALDEEYEEFCAAVDLIIDEKRDAFKEILTNYFAREGFIQGGEYINFAIEVENGEVSSYEWDVETDGDYEDSYEAYASYSFDYELENFKSINEDVLKQILNSRDYKIQLRRNLLQQPQQDVGTEYFLSMKASANKYVEGEVRVTVTFSVNRDEPDEMVTLFKELVEGDMDDEENLTVVFNKTLAQIASTINSGQFPEQESPATAGLNEMLVKTWKDYIKV
mgnify:FL=1